MLPLEHSAILSTFIKLLSGIMIFVLTIFEWPLKTGFTVNTLEITITKTIEVSENVGENDLPGE